jgi:hypothetical protein
MALHELTRTGSGETAFAIKHGDEIKLTITRANLNLLDPKDQALLKAYEEQMLIKFQIWNKLFTELGKSPDTKKNAQVEIELNETMNQLCSLFNNYNDLLKKLGIDLREHYKSYDHICASFREGKFFFAPKPIS